MFDSASSVVATGSYVPEHVVRNCELTQFPANAIPLIEQKTGVKARRHAASGEVTSDLGAKAAKACLDKAGVDAGSLDCIILATSSPDRMIPATATRIQHLLGATRACAFDVGAVCAGAVYAIHLADAMIRSGRHSAVLVIAAEIYSRILNPKDFSTYPYFGDGAGAILLVRGNSGPQVITSLLRADGSGADLVQVPAGGSMVPASDAVEQKQRYFTMNGRAVFDFAVRRGTEVIGETIQAAGLHKEDVSHVVLHQANVNIINRIAETCGIPRDRFFVNLDQYGNTAGASILIALDQLAATGMIKAGQYVVMAAFGGGLSWGGCLLRF